MARVASAVFGSGILLASALFLVPVSPAQAEIVVNVSKTQQRLAVMIDGKERYSWPVSTGRRGLDTPSGTFHPIRLERKWYSHEYHMSPMPYSIFFHGGYALHGTYERGHLGHAASHGCVRMLPANASILFNLVRKHRSSDAYIVVANGPLSAFPAVMSKPAPIPLPAARPRPDIIVPLPAPFKPQFDVPSQVSSSADDAYLALAKADDGDADGANCADGQAVDETSVEAKSVEAKSGGDRCDLPTLPERAALARYEDPGESKTEAKTEAKTKADDAKIKTGAIAHSPRAVPARSGDRFASVGDDATVMRGRRAWLRSLDRQYGIGH